MYAVRVCLMYVSVCMCVLCKCLPLMCALCVCLIRVSHGSCICPYVSTAVGACIVCTLVNGCVYVYVCVYVCVCVCVCVCVSLSLSLSLSVCVCVHRPWYIVE